MLIDLFLLVGCKVPLFPLCNCQQGELIDVVNAVISFYFSRVLFYKTLISLLVNGEFCN